MDAQPNLLSRVPQLVAGMQQALSGNHARSLQNLGDALSSNRSRFAPVKSPKLLRRPSVTYGRRSAPFAAIIPGDSVVETVMTTSVMNFLSLYNSALVIRLVLTWFPNPPEVISGPLSTICDPYLNLFRGLIPPLGGTLDFSPILAFVVLNVFTSSAAALPAEVPAAHQKRSSSERNPFSFFQLSPVQAVMSRFRHNKRQIKHC